MAAATPPAARASAGLLLTLVERAAAGDAGAFSELVASRLDESFRIALAILGADPDARDAVQDSFLKAWEELPRLRDASRFDAWFGRILVNHCRSRLRTRRRSSVREVSVGAMDETIGSRSDGRTIEERAASLDLVERAFERLSVDERALLVLHHAEHRQLADIAVLFGIPVGTAKSRLHAARRALERALEVESR